MTVITGWRRQILFVVETIGVNTHLVPRVLVGGNPKSPHVVGAAVAFRARVRDVRRIYRRERIIRGANAVHAVTANAGSDASFAFLLQQFSVNAGVVLFFLIDPQ